MSRPPPAFQPAPRPQPRLSPADAERLARATADLGFARPLTAAEPPRPRTRAAPSKAAAKTASTQASPASFPTATLKVEVAEAVAISLKLEAIRRRVTVRYLVLEALAAKGYAVDLARIPEDGRRLRG